VQYWSESQFKQLQAAPPGKLYSKGTIPWRLLAYLLKLSPEIARIQAVLHKRLMDEPRIQAGEKALLRMLITLHTDGFLILEPPPPKPHGEQPEPTEHAEAYKPLLAQATPELDKVLVFRSAHPLYGTFLVNQLGIANREERLQAMESLLEVPRPLLRYLR